MNRSRDEQDNSFANSALSAEEGMQAKGPSKESERYLRLVMRNTSDVMVVLDAVGTIRYVSAAVERILGYKPEELVGSEASGFVHSEDAERARETFSEALRSSGVQTPVNFRLRHADGSWRQEEVLRNNLLADPRAR